MLKVKYKYLLFSVVFSTISVLPNSCSLFKKQKEELSEAELKKELDKQKKKAAKNQRKANQRAVDDFWDRQSPAVKKRIKKTNKRKRKEADWYQ
jgi:uncharacterized protein YdaU (DUF1376 family)